MARPVSVWTTRKINKVKREMEEYTEKSAIPMMAEFAYVYKYNRTQLYKYEELGDSIKRMMLKKEFQLQKFAISGKLNPAFAIFSLKQLGWKDRQEEPSDNVEGLTAFFRNIMNNETATTGE